MKKLLFSAVLIFASVITVMAQDFEGIIEFKKQEGTAVENSVWYVKDGTVRVDEFEPGQRILKGCYIVNTKDNTARYLDHKAKTSSAVVVEQRQAPETTVEETKNTKEFQTYKATEFIVKTSSDTLQLSYWLNTGKFPFFTPTLKFMAHKNVFFEYYWALPSTDDAMPMLVTKSNAKGEETGRLEVTRIERKTIDANLFKTPADYKQQ